MNRFECAQAGTFIVSDDCRKLVRCRARGDGSFTPVLLMCKAGTIFEPRLGICVKDENQCQTSSPGAEQTLPSVVLLWPSTPSPIARGASSSTPTPVYETTFSSAPDRPAAAALVRSENSVSRDPLLPSGEAMSELAPPTTQLPLTEVPSTPFETEPSTFPETQTLVPAAGRADDGIAANSAAFSTELPPSDTTEFFTEMQEPTVTGVPDQTAESPNPNANPSTNRTATSGIIRLMKELSKVVSFIILHARTEST